MTNKLISALLLSSLLLTLFVSPALAEGECHIENGQIVCSDFGGGGGECGENCSEPPPAEPCDPGTTAIVTRIRPAAGLPGVCVAVETEIDVCTGEVLNESTIGLVDCESEGTNPCDEYSWGGGGFTCTEYCDDGWNWDVTTRLGFPEMYLDVRPFPATLVRWDTAMRASLMTTGEATSRLDYAPLGGGTEDDPERGDWRNIRLTLRLVPAMNVMLVELPLVGSLSLPIVGESGAPYIFHWELPSHPEAGGSVLAGNISGFDKVPADMPCFQGSGGGPYRLFYIFRYEEYTRRCRSGPNDDGEFECKTSGQAEEKDGHYQARWRSHSDTQEIPASAVDGLPAGVGVDLNGDGSPDAYWNGNLTLRRMDDAGSVHNPTWARSWNWGGTIYWCAREGQGQIGWPGTP